MPKAKDLRYNRGMEQLDWEQVDIVEAEEGEEIVVVGEDFTLPDDLEAVEEAKEAYPDETIYTLDQEEQRLLVKELLEVKRNVQSLEERLSKLENK